jgi:hypothetical protein
MTESIHIRRMSTREVKQIILTASATPPREPNLSELFSVLTYRADRNPLPEFEANPDPKKSTWGDDHGAYNTLFTITRLFPMLRACQEGKAPPGAYCAFQYDLDRVITGILNWHHEGVRLVLWLKRRIIDSFEPEAIKRLYRSHCLRTDPFRHDRIPFRSLLELPLNAPEPDSCQIHPIG